MKFYIFKSFTSTFDDLSISPFSLLEANKLLSLHIRLGRLKNEILSVIQRAIHWPIEHLRMWSPGGLNRGLTPNKPTHYQLDYGDISGIYTKRLKISEIIVANIKLNFHAHNVKSFWLLNLYITIRYWWYNITSWAYVFINKLFWCFIYLVAMPITHCITLTEAVGVCK